MKRLIIFLVIIMMLLSAGCGISTKETSTSAEDRPISTLETLAVFLDQEGFVQGVSQFRFIDKIVPQYQFEGKTLPEIIAGFYWDGKMGGGWACKSQQFGCSNSFVEGVYANELYTTVPLTGLNLPCRISFDDSVNMVLTKLGLDIQVPEEPDGMSLVLLSDKNRMLILQDLFLDPEVDQEHRYLLIFREKGKVIKDDEMISTERVLNLQFGTDQSGISRVLMRVEEKRG